MNSLFWSCIPIIPEPDHPQTLPVWVFQNGTAVNAISVLSAIKKLEVVQTTRYWAMETEQGLWDVQFDEDVTVESIRAYDMQEAVELARVYVKSDAMDPMIIRSPASTRLSSRRQNVSCKC
jgi:hypothetical protein